MGDLSPHFSRSEFREHGTGALPNGYPDPGLVSILERIRTEIARPLPIVSGYRSPAHNKAVGGARTSQHLVGRAADLPEGLVRLATAVAAGARGVGICRGWVVHVDSRPLAPNAQPVIFEDCPRR